MSEQNNIWQTGADNSKPQKLTEDMLLAYLDGKLSSAEQHDVELWLADEGLESDAVEGLQKLKPEEARHSVNKLKHGLRKKLTNKKRKRRQQSASYISWIAIAIILMLAVAAYIVIRMIK